MTQLTTINNQLPAAIEDLAKFVLIGRDRMASVRAEISAINRLGLAQEVRQQKLAEAQQISEVVLDAEVKLGELIAALPKAKNQYESAVPNGGQSKTKEESITGIGFTHAQAQRLETLAKHPEVVAQAKAEAREQDDIVSRSFVLEKIKAKEREQKEDIRREELQNPSRLPDGVYQVIYCDPPWQYNNSGLKGSAEDHYPTMSIEELKSLPVESLASDNAVMFMWATNPMLKDALELMDSWGFSYKTNIVWVKDRKNYGKLGFYVYGQHELLLIGVHGSLLPVGEKPSSVIIGANNVHSKKPESAYETIEAMYPGLRYVELFSRSSREGWTCWGNEVGKYE